MASNQRHTEQQKTFLNGAALLALSTVLVKLVGLLFKIPMLSILGSEGMGYFNSSFEIYVLFSLIPTAGLPITLSILISDAETVGNYGRTKRLFAISLRLFSGVGIFGSFLMYVGAGWICKWIKSPNAYGAIVSMSPTVFLISLASCFRGYFQGFRKMAPTAFSQVTEAIGKLVFSLLFASVSAQHGNSPSAIAKSTGFGVSLGTACALFYLLLQWRIFEKNRQNARKTANVSCESAKKTAVLLFKLSIPLTIGAGLASLSKLIDLALILRRLQSIGYSSVEANEILGSYTTMVLPIYALPLTLVGSVTLPLIPMLAKAIAEGDKVKQTQLMKTAAQIISFLSIPAGMGISAFATGLLTFLFPNNLSEICQVAPALSILGGAVFLSGMISLTNSILNAFQMVRGPLCSMTAGAIVKTVAAYLLLGNPKIGIFAAGISTLLCNLTVVCLNLILLSRKCDFECFRKTVWAPLWMGGVSVLGGKWAEKMFYILLLKERTCTVLAISATVCVFLILSLLFGQWKETFRTVLNGKKAQPNRFSMAFHVEQPKKRQKERKIHKIRLKNNQNYEKNYCKTGNNMVR